MRLPRLFRSLVLVVWMAGALRAAAPAGDGRPVVGPGATKQEVIAAYGWPNGQSQSGTKEILSYAQGEIILENGRVERVNFSPEVKWQAPRPKPAPPTPTTRRIPDAPVNYWVTDYNVARQEAQRRHAEILALFTGSDWSPASRQFQTDVETNPLFVYAFAGNFVFLKLDFPRGAPVPAKTSPENLELRDRFQVTTYPTLLLLSETGDLLTRVDLAKTRPEATYRERVIAAIREARDATLPPAPASAAVPAPTAAAAAPAAAATAGATGRAKPVSPRTLPPGVQEPPVAPILKHAGAIVALALVLGGGLVALVWWTMWRQPRPPAEAPILKIADRIDAAAGGLPSPAEMNAWPKEKLCAVTAGLAEFDNFVAHLRPAGGDIDLDLRRRSDTAPRVLVVCSPGSAGVVATKRLRELFGSLTAEGAERGWFVSPAGFSAECAEYAEAHRIRVVDGEGLHALMREVPPISLPGVLARE